jgi:CRISPR system Cascade subunit CasE
LTELVFARARLRRDTPIVALAPVLVPADDDQRTSATHRLLWSLYSDGPNRQRDFLWRETQPGEFLTLGQRAPVDAHNLFQVEHKPWAPALRSGQRLAFNLRANATKRLARGQVVDVVMDALHALPRSERSARRAEITHEAAAAWLQRQGERNGFGLVPETMRVNGYQQTRIPHGKRPISVAVLDLEGELIVREPETFLAGVAAGFGRAKAFGCGLMLLRSPL